MEGDHDACGSATSSCSSRSPSRSACSSCTRVTGAPRVPDGDDGTPRARHRRRGARRSGRVLVFALLVWEPALFRAHVAQLVPPLALLASLRPPPWAVLAVARGGGRAVLGGRQPTRSSGPTATGEPRPRWSTACGALPDGALVISDDPGLRVARRARPARRASPTRRSSASSEATITEASLARAAASRDVCGVVVSRPNTSGASPGSRPARGEGSQSEGFGDITVYTSRRPLDAVLTAARRRVTARRPEPVEPAQRRRPGRSRR